MTPAQLRAYQEALRDIPARHQAWLRSGDIELWAYYGLGIVLNDAQLEKLREVLEWPPGSVHVWRWANRTGKTTGLDILHGFATWYKWRYENDDEEAWYRYPYKTLHAAPLNELAGKAWELWSNIIALSADQQRNPLTNRMREAVLLPFFETAIMRDATGVDRPVLAVANNARVDFRSTQGGASRLESDAWWLIDWDEFPRQQPSEDIPILFDQTLLPRSSDFMAPIILSGTATIDSEHVYVELEELAAKNPTDWNFTTAARSANFAMSRASTARQQRLSIDKDVADRSVGGGFGGGSGSMFPHFALSNAFRGDLLVRSDHPGSAAIPPVKDDKDFLNRQRAGVEYITLFDHALGHDDNVLMTLEVPWPPHRASPDLPIRGANMYLLRSSRTLTPDEQHAYLVGEHEAYRSRIVIVDSTGPGGLSVYRKARADGLPVVDCNLQGRAAKWVTNKEFALQAMQRMFAFGLPVSADGFIEDWPEPSDAFGLFLFPGIGDWVKLRRQLAVYRRMDEKLRQDAAMTLAMGAWYLWRFIGAAQAPTKQRFNIIGRRRYGKPTVPSRR